MIYIKLLNYIVKLSSRFLGMKRSAGRSDNNGENYKTTSAATTSVKARNLAFNNYSNLLS